MLLYYGILFGLSIFFALTYAFVWNKHFDANITLVFFLVPICVLAHLGVAAASTLEEALLATKIIYFTVVFNILFVMLTILGLCHLSLPRIIRGGLLAITMVIYLPVLSIGYSDMFYKEVTFTERYGVSILTDKQYGIMHDVLYAWIFLCFLFCLIALIYSLIRKNDVSHHIINMLFIPVLVSMVAFFLGRMITDSVELAPAAYVLAQFIYLLIVHRLELYDINESAIESIVQKGDVAFISFDYKLNYLGSNETAKQWFPFLKKLHVDKSIKDREECRDTILKWISDFEEGKIDDENHIHYHLEDGKRIVHVEVNHLFDGRKRRGYQLFVTDATVDVQNMEFQEKFNIVLRDSVDKKTDQIRKMNDHLLISMAMLVESRDPFTGGHIKRTSEGVRLLLEEMKKDPNIRISEKFCSLVAKAAPMHDIGKIAIPDSILLFLGRYSEEQYAIMKGHSAEGAKVLSKILKDTDDPNFLKITVNVAHYHHERWDGKGYPERLSGEAIPLEARIMAIADVYDALVSKRVYKDKMPPEKANAIILEGMGTQFDPGLQKYYEAARPKIEAFYAAQLNEDATQQEEHPAAPASDETSAAAAPVPSSVPAPAAGSQSAGPKE